MKFTICDDTNTDLNTLESIIKSYSKKHNCTIEIEKYNNPENLLKNFQLNPKDYRIFFLDIIMQKNGIDIASKIRKTREDAIIIFTTSSKEYAINAFGVRAYDYLVKPLDTKQVFKCINRLIDEINAIPQLICKIKMDDYTITTVNIEDIAYIESINRRLVLTLKNGKKIVSTMLRSKFIEAIPFDYKKCNFVHCHASYVVNLNYISSISEKFFILENNEKIPISKSLLNQVQNTYIEYLVGE